MNQSFYAAAVAASQQQQRLNVTANNIANVNTVGFKAEQAQFSELLYQTYSGPNQTNVYRGTGSRIMQTATDFQQGALMQRDGGQNYAIDGSGFFAVLNPATNQISYTRAGSFHWGSTSDPNTYYLCDSEGDYVLDKNQQPIKMGEDSQAEYPVGVFDFANTDDMQHIANNKLVPVAKNGNAFAVNTGVIFGAVEGSNTDIATEFTKIIESQRSYSYALKMVQTQDEIESTINGLKG